MATIAIVGAGAVGGSIAAHLHEAHEFDVVLASRTPFETLVVETDRGAIRASPVVLGESARARPVQWVLLATKAYDTASAEPWIRALTGPNTVVAVLQNGVEHVARLARTTPRERILPVIVELPAHRIAPGHVVQHGAAALTVAASENGRRFARLFSSTAIEVHLTTDFVTAAWSKLAFNATGAVTAATLVPRLDLTRGSTEHLVRRIAEEAVAVGHAEGAHVTEDYVDTIVSALAASTSHPPNSMHADRLAGRPMEIEARNGAVVRYGRRHGIPTPVNEFSRRNYCRR